MKKVTQLLKKPIVWVGVLVLVAIGLAATFLGLADYWQPVKSFLDSDALAFRVGDTRFSAYLVLKAVVAIIFLFWVAGIFVAFGEARIKSIRGVKSSNKALLVKAFQIGTYFIAGLIGLDVMGVDLAALAIFGGAIGIGLGFGLQKITSNFISGLILLFEKSVEEDDLVELTGGVYGFVRHTGARYTLIETFEGKEIMVPNEDFITNRVTNWTFSTTKGRVEIQVGVSYDSDIEKAMELILEAAREHPRTSNEPEPSCFLTAFGASSVDFTLFFWVDNVVEGRNGPRSDVMRSIWKKFAENNIAIPYPQMDVHVKASDVKPS